MNELSLEDIPQPIWEEIAGAFPGYVIPEDFGQWQPNMVTRRCQYFYRKPLQAPTTIIDPATFEAQTAHPTTHQLQQAYMVRGLEFDHVTIDASRGTGTIVRRFEPYLVMASGFLPVKL